LKLEDAFERLSELSEGEVRVLLNDLLKLTTAYTKQGDGERRALGNSVRHLYSEHMKRAIEAEQRKRTIHIVFSLSDAGSLKVTLSKLGKRVENDVLAFNDFLNRSDQRACEGGGAAEPGNVALRAAIGLFI
jgi:hypothetical protein